MHYLLILFLSFASSKQVIQTSVGTESACDYQAKQMSGIWAGFDRLKKLGPSDVQPVSPSGSPFVAVYKCLPVDANGDPLTAVMEAPKTSEPAKPQGLLLPDIKISDPTP